MPTRPDNVSRRPSLLAGLRLWWAWGGQRARGDALDRIAIAYRLTREPRERWWFIGDRRFRRRIVEAMSGVRRYTAGESVKAGQLVRLGEDGKVYGARRG